MIDGARLKWNKADPVGSGLSSLPFSFVSESELEDIPAREWVIGRLLLNGHLSVLVAPGGVGKSSFSIALGLAIATGKDLIGSTVYHPGKVWIVYNEDDRAEIRRRLAALTKLHGISHSDIEGRIAITGGDEHMFTAATLDTNKVIPHPDVAACIDYIKQNDIRVLVVDPFIETHSVNENSNEQVKAVAALYRRIARETNCAVLLIHHTNKPHYASSEKMAGNMNSARGASSLTGLARIVLTLYNMDAKDAATFGIADIDRHLYLRLDDAKANFSLASPEAQWLKRCSVHLPNGDDVGALGPVILKPDPTAQANRDQFDQRLLMALLDLVEGIATINSVAVTLAWEGDSRVCAPSTGH